MSQRVTWRGRVMDRDTAEAAAHAVRALEAAGHPPVVVTQGCYNAGRVSASAGTHDGGGALDLSVRGLNRRQVDALVRALREAGFAAWYRAASEGPWAPHIHAVRVDCPDLAPSAARQVDQYRAGLNGLRNRAPDPHAALGVAFTTWAAVKAALAAAPAPYKAASVPPKAKPRRVPSVSVKATQAAARRSGRYTGTVAAALKAAGYTPTKSGAARLQRALGFSGRDADGVLGRASLTYLANRGKPRFTVKD